MLLFISRLKIQPQCFNLIQQKFTSSYVVSLLYTSFMYRVHFINKKNHLSVYHKLLVMLHHQSCHAWKGSRVSSWLLHHCSLWPCWSKHRQRPGWWPSPAPLGPDQTPDVAASVSGAITKLQMGRSLNFFRHYNNFSILYLCVDPVPLYLYRLLFFNVGNTLYLFSQAAAAGINLLSSHDVCIF